ncbi:MAG TPA: hypothetical protein VGK16_01620 [Candidatus Limnocylindrales bacterium]|jgi:hypothetical protein
MAAPFSPTAATPEQQAAIIEYGATWRAWMRCTERADRPAAEAAIRELYGTQHMPLAMEWRDSPVAAAAAARFAGGDDSVATNMWTIEDRLRLDPRWVRATCARLGDTPDYLTLRLTPRQPFRRLLGLREASAGIARPLDELVRQPLASFTAPTGVPDPGDVDGAGRLAFGEEWPRVLAILGRQQAGVVMRTALRTHAQRVSRASVGLVSTTLGQLDAFHPYVAAARDVLGLRLGAQHLVRLDAFLAIARSAGAWFALPNVAFVSERPVVCTVDPEGRLHAEDGPALAYGDGVRVYAWHGVRVPARVILEPDAITIADITAQPNAEVRRVLTERFGVERFVREPGSTLIHEDETGKLWRRWITPARRWGGGGEVVQMVEVLNATPEPDGTRKTYFLRVPPTIQTAREAVAWTFNLQTYDYKPSVET